MPLQSETILELLAGVDWFGSLTPEELQELTIRAEAVRWETGDVVFEEGDPGDHCYVIESGAVRVLRRLPDGQRVTLAVLERGSVFGELALLGAERRSATIQAIEPTVGVGLATHDVMAILRRDVEAALSVAAGLADRLRAANERLFDYALETVPGQVAAVLLAGVEARQEQGAGERDVELVGSAADVARLVGAPRESVTRVMHVLENQGIITMRRGKTTVHDPAALSAYLG